MKFHLRPWGVAAGALLSFALAGCNPPIDDKKAGDAAVPTDDGRRANNQGGAPGAPKSDEKPAPDAAKPTPDAAKPVESPTSSDPAKPVDSAPAPKDDNKKDEAPK